MRTSRGFVLIAVLFALVVLTALASGGFFEALQEMRIGRNASLDLVLQSAAESGIAAALAGWDPRASGALEPGAVLTLPGSLPAGLTGGVEARRLNDRLLLLRSEASDGLGTMRTVELIARLTGPELTRSAVRARSVDAVTLGRADGSDRNPSSWSCPNASGAAPGVVLEPGASDSSFFRFGSMDWEALVTWAKSVPAGGDSLQVVYQAGDTTLTGGHRVGTLVVDGDLVLRSGVEVVGLLIVRRALRIDGGGATVIGSVVASQVVVDQSVAPQEIALGYSSCSAGRAALSRALPAPLSGVPVWGVY
ncbi:MAG: hypothetical protein ACHQX4_02675 [Gemmatimonadales bacterium]